MIQLYHRAWDHHGGIVEGMKHAAADVRPGQRRAHQGSQATRHAGRHAHPVGRRIRPHADGPGHRTRSSHPRLQRRHGRRRRESPATYGATDELGYRAVGECRQRPRSARHDAALLGIDHKRLNVKFQGLDVRLTGVAGNAVNADPGLSGEPLIVARLCRRRVVSKAGAITRPPPSLGPLHLFSSKSTRTMPRWHE